MGAYTHYAICVMRITDYGRLIGVYLRLITNNKRGQCNFSVPESSHKKKILRWPHLFSFPLPAKPCND